MNNILMENKVLNLDKTDWKLARLGDLAKEITKRVDNPSESEYERFVGLGNFVSGDIKIKTWETTENLASSAKAFKSGDILFARRNAYLRRASLVDFDGCCSGDAFVLRENSEKVVRGFLAFLMNSNDLWDYANSNAAGTMSKRVKWRDLANYEFLLPPKEEQAQIAELLWAMDDVIEKEHLLKSSLGFIYDTLVDSNFSIKNDNWEYIKLSKVAFINEKSLKSGTPPDYTFKYLDIAGIVEPKIVGDLQTYTFSEAPSRARRIVNDNSIVLSLVRPYHKSFVYIEKGDGIIASTGTGVINIKDEELSRFVFHQFFSKRFILFCENRMTGTNYPAITPTDLKDFKVAIPKGKDKIASLAEKLDSIEKNIGTVQKKLNASKGLQKSLINQIF